MLTPEEKEIYVEIGGIFCPYCGSKRLAVDPIYLDGQEGRGEVICYNCNKSWIDVVQLVRIEEEMID